MKPLFPLTLSLCVGLLGGCVEPDPNAGVVPADQQVGAVADAGNTVAVPSYTVRGVYLGSAYDGDAATVDHEAIPGFMDAMRMTLRLGDAETLDDLREGDKIEFQLMDSDGTGYRMLNIEKLPEDTALKLGRDSVVTAVPEEDALPAGE